MTMIAASVKATLRPSLLIESFEGDWEKEWFTYKPEGWARSTHKLRDPLCAASDDAMLAVDARAQGANMLIVVIDDTVAKADLKGGEQWQTVVLKPSDFRDVEGENLDDYTGVLRLTLTNSTRLRTKTGKSQVIGSEWKGAPPRFRNLRWEP